VSFDRPGIYTIEATITDGERSGAAPVLVEVLGPTESDGPTFDTWISTYASVPIDRRGPADDPDGDGLVNLFEKFFACDPAKSEADTGCRLTGNENRWRIQFRQSKRLPPGSFYALQYREAASEGDWRLLPGVRFRQIRELADALQMEAEPPDGLEDLRKIDVRFRVIEQPVNFARRAKVSVSSEYQHTYAGSLAIDGIKEIHMSGEWSSAGESAPWIRLAWPQPVTTGSVRLYDRANLDDHTQTGTLTFSDGSRIEVTDMANNGSAKTITFEVKAVSWVRFQVTGGKGRNRGLSEIEVLSGKLLEACSPAL
jgi:hypothetical protein